MKDPITIILDLTSVGVLRCLKHSSSTRPPLVFCMVSMILLQGSLFQCSPIKPVPSKSFSHQLGSQYVSSIYLLFSTMVVLETIFIWGCMLTEYSHRMSDGFCCVGSHGCITTCALSPGFKVIMASEQDILVTTTPNKYNIYIYIYNVLVQAKIWKFLQQIVLCHKFTVISLFDETALWQWNGDPTVCRRWLWQWKESCACKMNRHDLFVQDGPADVQWPLAWCSQLCNWCQQATECSLTATVVSSIWSLCNVFSTVGTHHAVCK